MWNLKQHGASVVWYSYEIRCNLYVVCDAVTPLLSKAVKLLPTILTPGDVCMSTYVTVLGKMLFANLSAIC